MEKILALLTGLYGEASGQAAFERLQSLIAAYRTRLPVPSRTTLDSSDAILITYADQVQDRSTTPLAGLAAFCQRHLAGVVSGVHVLPFYPWSSDDGFSVKDYRQVDPAYGRWADLRRLGQGFRLMFDAVINHVSAQGDWFQGFLSGDPRRAGFFIVVAGQPDLSQVVRPRALPLLTSFQTRDGERQVWTTFGPDQVDLNYHNPEVLLEIIDILLGYVEQGAEFLRLDAVAYLWKEPGTRCIHLPQTHLVVRLIRAVLDEAAPHVRLITETNVPHRENLSYFGDGTDEAQLVYNFALPPLVLHTFHGGDARRLSAWAASLDGSSRHTTFFNFLASHDGIGLNPVHGILDRAEIEALVERVQAHGGLVSYKSNPDGSHSPYELNVNYFEALNDPQAGEPLARQVDRFIAAHAILLSLGGVPGIYFHSLFGSRGWPEGVNLTGRKRTINRQKLEREELAAALDDPASLRGQVFSRLRHLLAARAGCPAFDPHAEQRVLELTSGIFACLRVSPDQQHQVLCIHNVTPQPQRLALRPEAVFARPATQLHDLVSGQTLAVDAQGWIPVAPYQVRWLKLVEGRKSDAR
ncbi:MAG: sugar phosphorylase [Anaerolineales bacterium]|nr:sugar phosphorylase [Anaerolineales bacterium]